MLLQAHINIAHLACVQQSKIEKLCPLVNKGSKAFGNYASEESVGLNSEIMLCCSLYSPFTHSFSLTVRMVKNYLTLHHCL